MNESEIVSGLLSEAARLNVELSGNKAFIASIVETARRLKETVDGGGTIYVCGNGGSACDAMHLVEELVARFKRERPGIKAMHFMDASTLTCWSNDYDYHDAFARQSRTFCGPGDALIGISTSGNSKNVIKAIESANSLGCTTVAFTGRDGGQLPLIASVSVNVPHPDTERIQEVHITVIHILCELLERV